MVFNLKYLVLEKLSIEELKLYRQELNCDIKKINNEKLRVDRTIKKKLNEVNNAK